MRSFLDIDDLTSAELAEILDLSEISPRTVMAGRGAALIFEKPSNRTRNSMEMAVVQLGGHPITIRGEEIGLGVRETVEDVTKVLARYHAVVAARVFDHGLLESMAGVGEVPVVNMLSDHAHPCQVLADLLTLRQQWKGLEGRSLAWVGDGNNVARSLAFGCALAGIEMRLACPPGHELDEASVDGARALGGTIVTSRDPREAVSGADAVYTDVWVSMGQETESAQRLDAFVGYQVDVRLMSVASPKAVFLHCLPAHRGLEVAAEVIDGPASIVFDQAENRMHSARGLLIWLLRESLR